jgi:hypothetical protein
VKRRCLFSVAIAAWCVVTGTELGVFAAAAEYVVRSSVDVGAGSASP